MNKQFIYVCIFGSVLSISGLVLLYCVDWRVAVGIFLVMWGNNIGVHLQMKNFFERWRS